MPGRTEAEELRMLQQKAYGRGGALTAVESLRLRELEAARRSAPVAGSGAAEIPVDEAVPIAARETVVPAEDLFEAASADPVDRPDPDAPTAHGALRRSRWLRATAAITASAVVLAIGVGAGWALFAPKAESIPLTDEQQQRRAELAAAPFDPDSVRAIAQEGDALAWYATQDDGGVRCLILDLGVQSQTDCLSAQDAERGLSATLALPPDDSQDDETFAGGVVTASLFLSTGGEPIVGIQRWTRTSMLTSAFEGVERERAASLVAEGYEFGLAMVGSFRGEPVWLGDRLAEQGVTQRCLIVDATEAVACEPFETAVAVGLSAQIIDTDRDGAVTAVSVLALQFTRQQMPYLTVTADAAISRVEPGGTVVVEAPPGDPIEVEAPGRDLDG